MKANFFIQNFWFRLMAPVLYGTMVYILVLLVFDSLEQFWEHFLGQELLVSIILCYAVFESNRFVVLFFKRWSPMSKNVLKRVTLQFAMGILSAWLVVYLILLAYFKRLLGYNFFQTELVVFASIFTLTSVFYNLLYFSLFFLNEKNNLAIDKERSLHDSLKIEFENYQRELRPELFTSALESLVELIRKDPNAADKFINSFASIFRYIIDSKKLELISLKEEIDHVSKVISILNFKYENAIEIIEGEDLVMKDDLIVPCALQIIIENAVINSIISSRNPLKFSLSRKNGEVCLKHDWLPKILSYSMETDLVKVNNSFRYYTGKSIDEIQFEDKREYRMPLISDGDIKPLE